jgi:hypothetical protein
MTRREERHDVFCWMCGFTIKKYDYITSILRMVIQVVNVVSMGAGMSVSGSNRAPELFLDMPRRLPTDSDRPMPGIPISCDGPIPNTSNCADCCPNGECMIGPGASRETT